MARSEEAFAVRYDGPALAEHRMDVRQLAPALLAFADAMKAAQSAAAPEQAPAQVHITATSKGSFQIELLLVEAPTTGLFDRIADALSGDKVSAAVNLGQIVEWASQAVILTMTLARARIRKREPATTPGKTKLTLSDGSTIETDNAVINIYQNSEFRTGIRDAVAPLKSDGVNELAIQTAHRQVIVTDDQVDAFTVPDRTEDEELLNSVRDVNLQIVAPAFDGGKWRVSDGSATFFVTLADEQFRDQVIDSKAAFRASDILMVRLRTRQFRTDSGLKTEHVIEQVIKHLPAGRQLELPLDEDEAT